MLEAKTNNQYADGRQADLGRHFFETFVAKATSTFSTAGICLCFRLYSAVLYLNAKFYIKITQPIYHLTAAERQLSRFQIFNSSFAWKK